MKHKGFTLIELLAVIVILAIIAVIAIPRILNVVEEAKKGSAEASALGYIDAVEKQIMINAASKKNAEITDNTYPVPLDPTYGVTVKGKAPESGEIVIENGKVKTYTLIVDGYIISYDGTTKSVTKSEVEVCNDYEINEVVFENGTPNEHTLSPKCTGTYKLEVWGAQGASYNSNGYQDNGGYGAYSVGEIKLTKNVPIYINVGGAGRVTFGSNNGNNAGGYNGGGNTTGNSDYNSFWSSGGGATHIAYEQGELKTLEQYKGTLTNNEYYVSERIIIVAGGGGGASRNVAENNAIKAGSGGGKTGAEGQYKTYTENPGTQTTGAAFGVGESGLIVGGGGGFYGGSIYGYGSAGGSGYIANPKLKNKKMVMYGTDNKYASNDAQTKTELTTQVNATATANQAKSGNGYAKITYLG